MLRLEDFAANVIKSGWSRRQSSTGPGPGCRRSAGDAGRPPGPPADPGQAAHRLTRPASSSRARPAASSWADIACSARSARGAWARSTWPQNDRRRAGRHQGAPARARPLEDENALLRFRREMDLSRRCVAPQHRPHAGRRRRGRRPLHGDGVHPRREPLRDGQGRAGRARSASPTPPGCSSSSLDGLDAAHAAGPDPPRHQAVERDDHARRRGQAARPGPGPRPRRREGDHPRQHRPRDRSTTPAPSSSATPPRPTAGATSTASAARSTSPSPAGPRSRGAT